MVEIKRIKRWLIGVLLVLLVGVILVSSKKVLLSGIVEKIVCGDDYKCVHPVASSILREKAVVVSGDDSELSTQIAELVIKLKDSSAVGLAAPQIGVSKRFFAIKTGEDIEVYLNPEIKETYGVKSFGQLEGCVSFPNFFGTVKRYQKIKVGWQTVSMSKEEVVLEGYKAIIFQHELDHLNGILFFDRTKEDNGRFYKKVKWFLVPWSLADFSN